MNLPPPDTRVLGVGFVGRRLLETLGADGQGARGTVRDPQAAAVLRARGLQVAALDLDLDPERLSAILVPGENLVVTFPPDAPGDRARALARGLALRPPSRVVLLSSTGVYLENAGGRVDEQSATAKSPRARTRLAFEEVLTRACASGPEGTDIPLTILRLPALYGPGRGLHRSLLAGRIQRWGEGKQRINRLHIDDLVAALLLVLTASSPLSGIYNLGDDHPAPLGEVVAWLSERMGLPLPPTAPLDEAPESLRASRQVDSRSFREATGWQPRTPSYKEGFEQVLRSEGV